MYYLRQPETLEADVLRGAMRDTGRCDVGETLDLANRGSQVWKPRKICSHIVCFNVILHSKLKYSVF